MSSGRTPPGAYSPPPQSGAYPSGQPYAGQPGGFPAAQPYGDPPYDGAPAAPAAKRSRVPLVLSLALAGILVLCLGGGGLAYVALSGDDEPAPVASSGATPSAAPSTGPDDGESAPAETPSDDPSADPRTRLVTPKSLGGRPKSTDPELKTLADQMVRDMKSTVSRESGAIGAFYGSPEKQNIVMVVGASGFVLDPEKELNDAVKGVTTDLSVRKMATVSPGPLGGLAKCGDGESSEVPLGVCVWADQGSVGMIVMFFSSGSKAKAEFVSIRGQIEKRS
ncbi:hypothetical protein ACTMSW_10570 [Micromonospora sp. BQ11]|uniref:hypothetical protein n=1 Tax=Micromonospora sp. BQ11 TaxID=3452212 RepID=UPI003F89ABF0